MTDEQIIKALECCSIDDHIGVCTECPFTDICDEDTQALQKYALDLINRQKAEIERYKKYYETMETEIYSFRKDQADVKFLKNKIRAEAIKEFAEAYKEQIKDYTGMFTDDGFYISLQAALSSVDFIKEKMTEEKK